VEVSLESHVVLSALHAQSARDALVESLAVPQTIAPMPRVCAELEQLTAEQSADGARLARLIQSDPALVGELMRVANSPAVRPRSPVVSLPQAVSWLGVAEVRNIAMAVALRGEAFVAPGHEPASEDLWREAWLAALWAKELARLRRRHVDSAFLAALMHRTGAALALKILSRFEMEQRTVMDARSFSDLLVEFEPAFGRLLMKSWSLPREVRDAASDWRQYATSPHSELAGTVHAAHLLATHTLYPQLLSEDVVLGSMVFEHLGLLADARQSLLTRRDAVRSLAGV
jgi:HD-like signal output (HDOD) protein